MPPLVLELLYGAGAEHATQPRVAPENSRYAFDHIQSTWKPTSALFPCLLANSGR